MKYEYRPSVKSLVVFVVCTILTTAGCVSGDLDRGRLEEQIGIKSPVVTDNEISKILSLKPNLPKPFTLCG